MLSRTAENLFWMGRYMERADATARSAIKEQNVDLRYYSIIYEAIDDVKQALSGLRERGFELMLFEDSVAFRAEYEERYRSAWDRGEAAPAKALSDWPLPSCSTSTSGAMTAKSSSRKPRWCLRLGPP